MCAVRNSKYLVLLCGCQKNFMSEFNSMFDKILPIILYYALVRLIL